MIQPVDSFLEGELSEMRKKEDQLISTYLTYATYIYLDTRTYTYTYISMERI